MPVVHQTQQVHVGTHRVVGVALDVRETGIGEHFQERADPAGVGRRFQEQRFAAHVEAGGLEQLDVFPPPLILPALVHALVQEQVIQRMVPGAREVQGHIWAEAAGAHHGDFFFLRHRQVHRYVVHAPVRRQRIGNHAAHPTLAGQERIGQRGLIRADKAPLGIHGHQVVEQSGSRTPEAQQEQWLRVQFLAADAPSVGYALPEAQRREHRVGNQYSQETDDVSPVHAVTQSQTQCQRQASRRHEAVESGAEGLDTAGSSRSVTVGISAPSVAAGPVVSQSWAGHVRSLRRCRKAINSAPDSATVRPAV